MFFKKKSYLLLNFSNTSLQKDTLCVSAVFSSKEPLQLARMPHLLPNTIETALYSEIR